MWKTLWERHTGALSGLAAGIFLGFIYLFFGFWDMLIFAFIAFIGFYVGRKLDRREPFTLVTTLWNALFEKWRLFR